ncbi:MAG: hypothetical protein QXJ68_01260 [Methanocellales archaeon]
MQEKLLSELKRKTIHVSGSLIAILYLFTTWEIAILVLSICFLAALFLEWQRLERGWQFSFARPHEQLGISGALYFAFSSLLAVLFFQKEVAISTLLMLAVGDSITGIAGAISEKGILKIKGRKPLYLFLMMLIICFLLAHLFLPFKVALIGAIIAALVDSLPLNFYNEVLDDNLTIPLLSGTAMSIAML